MFSSCAKRSPYLRFGPAISLTSCFPHHSHPAYFLTLVDRVCADGLKQTSKLAADKHGKNGFFCAFCAFLWLLNLNIHLAHCGWREASPLLASGCNRAETSGPGLKFGKRFRGEYDTITSMLLAWIEERQIVAGKMQV